MCVGPSRQLSCAFMVLAGLLLAQIFLRLMELLAHVIHVSLEEWLGESITSTPCLVSVPRHSLVLKLLVPLLLLCISLRPEVHRSHMVQTLYRLNEPVKVLGRRRRLGPLPLVHLRHGAVGR